MKFWPFFENISSSEAKIFGIHVYGENTPKIIKILHVPIVFYRNIKYNINIRLFPYYYGSKIDLGLSPGFYDSDFMLESAIVAVCKHYLEVELGTDKDDSDHKIYGNYHKGYRLHHVGDERNIDLILEILQLYEDVNESYNLHGQPKTEYFYQICEKYNFNKNLNSFEIENMLRDKFTEKLKELMEKRGHMWT